MNAVASNSQELSKVIFQQITTSSQQRITFAEFMNLVLYHQQFGYYSSGVANIGSAGDFFTSSSLGRDFGELLATQLVEMWQNLGSPDRFTVVEMGAGNGSLAADILAYVRENELDFTKALEYIIIERSPALIARQQKLLKSFSDLNLTWKTWAEIPDNYIVGCCFANELVDAFPVHQLMVRSQKLKEVYLTVRENQLTEVVGELSTSKLKDYFNALDLDLTSERYPDNYRTEVNLTALDWLKTITRKLKKGYLITIDYGYTAEKYYHPQRSQGTLQCYYRHRRHNNPYVNLGEQDLTTHVDFTALERQGKLLGLENIGFTKQGMFLMALGLSDRLNKLSSGEFSPDQIFKRRDALHQLISPTGLGSFGVLIQGKDVANSSSLRGLKIPAMR
ncbi:class I SAM-dependent methyltransferase [Myxosarcina sp. GI1]|uniref:class I SAM-dependent methyltransferase n=1 Tax=Myxosarcina sp. GI1 TaxID=1541065 RepID=UPI00055D1ACE|nr:class I SAM-dependent methyltransferase [Myxosarcina sp. GI1]